MEILGDVHFWQKKVICELKGLQYAVGVPEVCEREPWQQKTCGGGGMDFVNQIYRIMGLNGQFGKASKCNFSPQFCTSFWAVEYMDRVDTVVVYNEFVDFQSR